MKYLVSLSIILTNFVYLSGGCCSHHKGVDYCGDTGYYICQDGTQSPSCECFNESDFIITDTETTKYKQNSDTIVKTSIEDEEISSNNTSILEYIGLGFTGFMIIGSIYCAFKGKLSSKWYG